MAAAMRTLTLAFGASLALHAARMVSVAQSHAATPP
jgi:hypothetical protein